jgi:hypothetical protein
VQTVSNTVQSADKIFCSAGFSVRYDKKDFRFDMMAQNFHHETMYNVAKYSYNITAIFIGLSIDIFADV